MRREALEETGIRVDHVAYHSSQPWPFPANLIFGAFGLASQTSNEIRLDLDAELEDAFFAPRQDVLAAVEATEQKDKASSEKRPTRHGHRYLYVLRLTQRAAAVGNRACAARLVGARRCAAAGQIVGWYISNFSIFAGEQPSTLFVAPC